MKKGEDGGLRGERGERGATHGGMAWAWAWASPFVAEEMREAGGTEHLTRGDEDISPPCLISITKPDNTFAHSVVFHPMQA